jgi:hypothetical protein
VVVTAAFGPSLQQRNDLTPEHAAVLQGVLDSLGMSFSHPLISFVPSLGVRVNLPEPVAGETFYVLHFGTPEDAEVIWTGPAATGDAIEATVVIGPSTAASLAAGEPISLTAVAEGAEGENEGVFSIQITPVGQGPAVAALLNYMSRQLSTDLARLLPPPSDGDT